MELSEKCHKNQDSKKGEPFPTKPKRHTSLFKIVAEINKNLLGGKGCRSVKISPTIDFNGVIRNIMVQEPW